MQWALRIYAIVITLACLFLAIKQTLAILEVADADSQTAVFDELRLQALNSGPTGAADYLETIVYFYPSGTKQRTGSPLDRQGPPFRFWCPLFQFLASVL
jgi:hypothetical protein